MNEQRPEPVDEQDDGLSVRAGQWRLIQIISAVVFVWGSYLAAGAMFKSGDKSLRPVLKGLIILGCFAAFIGFWALLLWVRERRLAREAEEDEEDETDAE